ncbi:MAG: hypothetical protein ABJC74_09420 [Gemmatimonadota bacterium]
MPTQRSQPPARPFPRSGAVLIPLLLLLLAADGCGGTKPVETRVDPATVDPAHWRVFGRSIKAVTESGQSFVRLGEGKDAGMVWNPALQFSNGDIDVDLRGRDVAQKSFLGIAFHLVSEREFEVVWLRPFNFVGADSAHHVHAIQYASYPDYSWATLRDRHPGDFEAAVPPGILAEDWVHLRLSVRGQLVRIYLDHSLTPSLALQRPGGPATGAIGFWVGDQSPGDFANLVVRPTSEHAQ